MNITILFSFYVLSFFIGELDLSEIGEYFEILPGFLQSRKGYLNEEYAQSMKDAGMQYAFHIQFYRSVLKYLIVFFCTWLFLKYKKEKNDLKWHVLTFFVCLGSLYSVYLSIVYWNK